MENEEQFLKNIQKQVFNYARFRLDNYDLAKEITAQTISLYILKRDSVNIRDTRNWIIGTCRNLCTKAINLKKKDKNLAQDYRDNTYSELHDIIKNETNSELRNAYREVLYNLDQDELKTILYYFQCNSNIKEMGKDLEIPDTTLRQRISRIKRKIKAETFLAIGKVTTKKIITPQLNNQIRKFLDRFKENLEKNTLNKMYYYFSEKKLDNYNPDFYIDKILDYEIELTNSIYKLWVFFESKENKRDSFFIRFFIDNNNYLKIKTPPKRPEKHIVISTDSEEGKKLLKLINDYPENKEGFYNFPTTQLEDIINKLEKKKESEKNKKTETEKYLKI